MFKQIYKLLENYFIKSTHQKTNRQTQISQVYVQIQLTSKNPNWSRKLRRYVMILARVINFCLTQSLRIRSKQRWRNRVSFERKNSHWEKYIHYSKEREKKLPIVLHFKTGNIFSGLTGTTTSARKINPFIAFNLS